jgi:periplasmic protein CpxP/Spy
MFKRVLLAVTMASLSYAAVPGAVAQDSGAQSAAPVDQQSAPATGRRGRHFDPAKRAERMAKHLNLSSDQQSKVQQILTAEQSQMQQLRADSSLNQQDRRSKMMDIHQKSNDEIRALLNGNQQQEWDEMQKKRRERMEKHGRRGQPSGEPGESSQQPQ